MTHVRSVLPDEWQIWKSLRLQALADSPDAFGSTYEDARQQSDSYWKELVESGSLLNRAFLVAERDGGYVGMVRVGLSESAPSQAGLFSMWVMPSERGQGVGKALVNAVIEWARSRGASELVLYVVQRNHQAKRLYLSSGFIGTGEIEPLHPGASRREEVMILNLR